MLIYVCVYIIYIYVYIYVNIHIHVCVLLPLPNHNFSILVFFYTNELLQINDFKKNVKYVKICQKSNTIEILIVIL